MSDQQTIQDDEPIYEGDDRVTEVWDDEPEPEELPRRPKRRLVTPWTLTLAAVLVAALGFIGGVQVQKGQEDGGAAGAGAGGGRAAAAGGLPAGARAAFGGGGAAQGDGTSTETPTLGQVASKDGDTLYVTDGSGATVKVRTNGNSKVTRTAKSEVADVHPGDTVVVIGPKNDNGTVTATQITATGAGASAFPGGGGGGFGGGGRRRLGGGAGGAGGGAGGGGNAGATQTPGG